jgi:biopolymer transport protein ExbD
MFDWDETPELNITPLVDVMLVLLSILMVTAPTMVYEELIQLPQGSKQESLKKSYTIEIRVTQDKRISIKNQSYTFQTFADDFLLYAQNISKQTPVVISADERIIYKDLMYILKSVKVAGFAQVSLATDG